jgi:hypothetical protein
VAECGRTATDSLPSPLDGRECVETQHGRDLAVPCPKRELDLIADRDRQALGADAANGRQINDEELPTDAFNDVRRHSVSELML